MGRSAEAMSFVEFWSEVLAALERRAKQRPVRIDLALPEVKTKEGTKMANFELQDDKVYTIPILTRDAAGDVVAAPAGDTFSVVSSNPASLDATVGADANGAPAVVLTPMVQASPNLTVTVSDSAGLEVDTQGFDIVGDLTPKAIGLDLSGATTTDQPVPTNPGP
jgi:hypothetical protein